MTGFSMLSCFESLSAIWARANFMIESSFNIIRSHSTQNSTDSKTTYLIIKKNMNNMFNTIEYH